MDFTGELLRYLRNQYEKATGKTMVADCNMKSSQAPFYFQNLDDNLIVPMGSNAKKNFGEGDGNELEGKMRALRSSSAMTFNLLGNDEIEVRSDSKMFVPGRYQITYEKQIDTIKGNLHKANLDAFLEGKNQLIFCEMKMTEWLFNRPGVLRESYLNKNVYKYPEIYDAAMECLNEIMLPNPTDYKTYYCALSQYDAFQMFKHTLAIYNYVAGMKDQGCDIPSNIKLVNCVWHLPADADFSNNVLAVYMKKEQLEHCEFAQFYAAADSMIHCFSALGVKFDIVFMSAEDFAEQFVSTPEREKYLGRYFGRKGTKRTMKHIEDEFDFENRMKLILATQDNFYRIPELNYTGKTNGYYYTEIIAYMLYEEFYKGTLPNLLLRGSDLKKEEGKFPAGPIHFENGQKQKQIYNPNSNRTEEIIAKRLFEQDPLKIINCKNTQVIDYQVPVNRVLHSGEGKVDLILVNESLTILGELKKPDSHETLLRAIVEVETYYQKIKNNPTAQARFMKAYGPQIIHPAVIIFDGEGSQPWKDYTAMKNNELPELSHLAAALHIMFFVVHSDTKDDYIPYSRRNYELERI